MFWYDHSWDFWLGDCGKILQSGSVNLLALGRCGNNLKSVKLGPVLWIDILIMSYEFLGKVTML